MDNPPRKRKKATSTSSDLQPAVNPQNSSPQDNQDLVTIDVPAVEVPELTPEEQSDRLHLERKVERAFFEAGKALAELRDRRLYRSTHRTFEDYCRDRFGHSRQQSNYLIAAAGVYENLTTIGCQNVENENLTTICCQILPTNERQVRPLTKLEPQQQQEVWQQAVEEAGGKVPTGKIVKDVVQRIMERTQVLNSYQLGEVCQILAKDNPELRGKGGCWAIVAQVNNFSCTVRNWDGELTVGLKHLKSYEYLPEDCQQMQEICERISRVYSSGLEESVQKFLESLGKLKRAYITAVEEKRTITTFIFSPQSDGRALNS
ncbi:MULTISPECIES: hypothetical protein [unclassified Tolypothrix]|uniref:hypothetical protein n=1 Tax=unclassified Tolypothrix TaxID=2649714 RepID=UPI0005EAA400|nr:MULTISPECIES: hypothetical protein [unclassified Tolypothrix]BAY93705.1 hypothetical protein NIES3275_57470 [Microchaete diplosiphon NIES-3275]EKF03296.1 hypothetical protein FDUTEX481_02755 [Tolypothrix sp. PCC 7601]MBE9082563.1 hypothetical protein [Tolypothrix sp. LEGE 11397]UYD27517.1 hypothetical protein HGR01_05385 [Tolypothrix sp. PCC 7712]UYD36621.1 hypothetical protein HG267_13325 [Tolypothrix sp. PCC 7601]